MATLNRSGEEIKVKVVYYGPGLSGKTTNFDFLHAQAPARSKGNMVVTTTRTDRTLSFELIPKELSDVNGYSTKYLFYTVPGQIFYNATRKLVLEGVDAVVFVADSSRDKFRENIEHLRDLEENLNEYGISLDHLPWVIQYNKRDLPDATPVEELHKHLNLLNVPAFEAVATEGRGVYETFKEISAILHARLLKKFQNVTPPASREEGTEEVTTSPDITPERREDEVSNVVDAAFREMGVGEQAGAPETHMAVMPASLPPASETGDTGADEAETTTPHSAPQGQSAQEAAPPVVEMEQETEESRKQEPSVDLWAQSVGSATRADLQEESSAQPPASARETSVASDPTAKRADAQLPAGENKAGASIPEIGPGHIPTTTTLPEQDAENAETFSFDQKTKNVQQDDIGRLVEFDEETETVEPREKEEIPEFITDPMQRSAVPAKDEKIEHIERPSQLPDDRGTSPREDFEIKVPVVISRSQVKKTMPLKLILEIQVVDD